MTNRQNWANRGVDPYKNMTWNEKLLEDAVEELLTEIERLRKELDKQMGYIDWLEEFAPKAGDAYELAKGIHWTQMEEEE